MGQCLSAIIGTSGQEAFSIQGTIVFHTSWGWCALAATEAGISSVILPQPNRLAALRAIEGEPAGNAPLAETAAQELREYFQQQRREFTVPVDISALPAFTRRTLVACATIPWGAVVSYGQLAARIGSPRAARAVGQAMGRNPVPILIPCHRVIAANGSLGGYGGGLGLKTRLLRLEGVVV